MPWVTGAARIGDLFIHDEEGGGAITSGTPLVTTDLLLAARVGDTGECSIHDTVTIASGSAVVLCALSPRARIGDAMS